MADGGRPVSNLDIGNGPLAGPDRIQEIVAVTFCYLQVDIRPVLRDLRVRLLGLDPLRSGRYIGNE